MAGEVVADPQTVLVVDDEEDIRESLRDIIETCIDGVLVHAADSGEAALALLEERSFDLIVTDFRMPGMNGLDFLIAAHRVAPQVPRVLVTAYPDLDLVVRAINEGHIINFLPKPFRGESVVKVVSDALGERHRELGRRRELVAALNTMRRGKE